MVAHLLCDDCHEGDKYMDSVPADYGQSDTAIVITASRLPGGDPAAASTIFDESRIERLGAPNAVDYLRLSPSVSVSTSGPAGSLTEVRIRGAESSHTLLFVDGIRANDPAAGNTPRFELLNADIASRIALARGPQSALWGSEAIGGVIAVDGAEADRNRLSVGAEAGSFGFGRGQGTASVLSGNVGATASVAHHRSSGIDSFDGSGDRDGYRNTSLRGLIRWQATPSIRFSLNGFHLTGRSEFDGFDPFTFLRADTRDESRNRLRAGRIAVDFAKRDSSWSGAFSASLLGSKNRNLLAGADQNYTEGARFNVDGQINRRFSTGAMDHQIALAGGYERERYNADDIAFGGFTRQNRYREHQSLTGEWRAKYADRVTADVAVRRDSFNRFGDATSVRAALDVKVASPVILGVAFAQGIAQPSFFDLYGFFPGSFVGNPYLKPERSSGWEVSARIVRDRWSVTLVGFRQRLREEIVDTFDPGTFLSSTINATGKSRRSGVEFEASFSPASWLQLSAAYAFLDADQPALTGPIREARRPRHSGSVAAAGMVGKFSYGASIAYVGQRRDTDFDQFPAADVTLSPYWLAGARIAYRIDPRIELHARIANAFNDRYQDVVGYRTEGRSMLAGLRVNLDR